MNNHACEFVMVRSGLNQSTPQSTVHGSVATSTPCDVYVVKSRLYQGINTKKNLEVLSLLRPIVQ